MRKLLILICIAAVTASCGSKPAKSPDFLYGSKLYSNFVNYYLKGEPRLAEMAFASAENQFLKMDALCNLSRIYIGRFVLDESGVEKGILEKSRKYAELGKCFSENEAISFLSGEKYDKDILPEPYSQIAGADNDKLVSISENKDLPDYTKTRLLRKVAIAHIVSNPTKSEELVQRALIIDKFNGWSVNILRDLVILKLSAEKQGKDTSDIKQRIELIKAVVSNK